MCYTSAKFFLSTRLCVCVCARAQVCTSMCMAGGDYVCGLGYILSCPSSMFPSLEVPGREEKSEVSGVEASGLRPFQSLSYLHFSLRNRLGWPLTGLSPQPPPCRGVPSHRRVGAGPGCSGSWLGFLSPGGNSRGQVPGALEGEQRPIR